MLLIIYRIRPDFLKLNTNTKPLIYKLVIKSKPDLDIKYITVFSCYFLFYLMSGAPEIFKAKPG